MYGLREALMYPPKSLERSTRACGSWNRTSKARKRSQRNNIFILGQLHFCPALELEMVWKGAR
jgi:hypothetical protein